MSRNAPAVQFYAEDFLGGARFLSNAETGLYIRILCEQVDKGHVPDDVEHFVKAYGNECRKLWPAVRAKFIAGTEPGTMVNERMATAIATRDAFRLKQSEKGKMSASSRSNPVQPRFNHGSTTVEPLGDGENKRVRKERANASEGFDEFYASYPTKKARGAAEKAWAKLTPDERKLCLPAIVAQVAANHFRGTDGNDYTPHPATWLNARRWEDEVVKNRPALNIGGGMTKEEAEAEMLRIRIANGRDPILGFVGDEECSRELLIYRGRIKRA